MVAYNELWWEVCGGVLIGLIDHQTIDLMCWMYFQEIHHTTQSIKQNKQNRMMVVSPSSGSPLPNSLSHPPHIYKTHTHTHTSVPFLLTQSENRTISIKMCRHTKHKQNKHCERVNRNNMKTNGLLALNGSR